MLSTISFVSSNYSALTTLLPLVIDEVSQLYLPAGCREREEEDVQRVYCFRAREDFTVLKVGLKGLEGPLADEN